MEKRKINVQSALWHSIFMRHFFICLYLDTVAYNDKALLTEQHYEQPCDENNLFDSYEKCTCNKG